MNEYNNIDLDYCIAMNRGGYAAECDADNKKVEFIKEN